MASSHANENATQCKSCQCGRDPKSSESSDKQPQKCPNCQGLAFRATAVGTQIKLLNAYRQLKILKNGPLFLSSKGIGWTQWKKRWFVLMHTSLIYYRSDPNALPQKGSDANPILGTIDLNNTGSVVLKADKKLLTLFFPDGNDGRTYTLKGETSEELQEWKCALENALVQAPSVAFPMGQNGIVCNETADSVEASFEQWRDRKPVNSTVVGRPVLLALEEVDGSPSFLEKALRFIEDYGIKVEGILRQSADVEEVERRVQDYEHGKKEFSPDEDAHVIGDCIKHILRELPSSPVPASCCTALVEAYKTDRGNRINAIRDATYEKFPEPNLRLLQRILKMMKIVASHRSDNRMSVSALAACMAPLLLRPLLAGDCEFEDNFNMGGDGSLQLLRAAAAANHAQAIVIIMLEEYERIFDDELSQDESLSSESYTETEDDIEDDESTDNDILEDDGYHDAHNGLDADSDDDLDHSSSGTVSGGSSYVGSDISDNEEEDHNSGFSSPGDLVDLESPDTPSSTLEATALVQDIGQKTSSTNIPLTQGNGVQKKGMPQNENSDSADSPRNQTNYSIRNIHASSPMQKSHTLHGGPAKFRNKSHEETASMRRPTKWGRTPARKNLSMESIDYSTDDENAIQRLETTKTNLETKVTKEVQGNAILQESLEKRKQVLHERRLALEKDVEILQEQLQKERDLKASLEVGLMNTQPGNIPVTFAMDSKTRVDLEEINLAEADIINLKHEVTELHGQLSHHLQSGYALLCTSCKQRLDKQGKEQEKIIDRALLHQNETPSTNDGNSSSVPFKNAQAQKEDLPSSPDRLTSQKATLKTSPIRASGYMGTSSTEESSTIKSTILPKKLSISDEIISSPTDGVDLVTKSHTSLSSPKGQPRKKKSSSTNKNMMLPLEAGSISSNELPTAPNNSTSRDKNTVSGPDLKNRRPQTKDSCPSTDMKLSQQPLRCDEAIPVTSDSSSMKSASKGENPEFGADVDTDSEYRDAENQNLPTLADARPSQKLLRQMTTNQSRTKSNDTSSTEGPVALTQNFASKKSSFWTEDMKQESQNFPSMSNRQQSQRHQSSTSGVKDDTALVGCIAALKMSSGSEGPQDSSSMQNRELSQKHLSSVSGVKDDTALVGRNAVSKKPSRSEEPRDSPSIANKQLSQKHKSGTTDAKDDAALVGSNAASKKSSRSEVPQDSPSITNKQPSQKHQTDATGVKDNTALVTCPSSSKKSSKSEDQVGTTCDKNDTTLVARPASSKKSSKSEDQKGTTGVKDDTALVGRPASSKKSSKSENQTGSTGVKDNTALVGCPASSKKSSKSEDQTSTTGVKDNTALVGCPASSKKSSKSKDQIGITCVKDDTALVGRPASSKKSSKSEDQIGITCVKDDTVLIGRPAASKKSSKSEDLTGTCGVKYDTALLGRPAKSKKSSKSEDLTGTTGVKHDTALVRCPAASKKSSKSEDAAPSSSSSSALLRLTNRLNFLKERRLQLANEVQNLDAKRASGPEHPPRTNSR